MLLEGVRLEGHLHLHIAVLLHGVNVIERRRGREGLQHALSVVHHEAHRVSCGGLLLNRSLHGGAVPPVDPEPGDARLLGLENRGEDNVSGTTLSP